ncbi:MAG: UMP kinase [Bacteroidales bacterium]|nr:UMP kinase [Bacteroidales bacterium]
MKFKRILLKLSGESLMGENQYGISSSQLDLYANEIKNITKEGVEVAVVLGGGNIFRGLQGTKKGIDRVQGDYMGMLATIINSLALQAALDTLNINSVILSGIEINPLTQLMSRRKAIHYLRNNNVVIIAGGTGNPYFTTDSAAALRASEINADVILKGTRVDGIYDTDPEKNPNAVKFETLTFDEAYEKKLNIMDLTAFTLCKENNVPIIVFNINKKDNLIKIINGEKIGTLVSK